MVGNHMMPIRYFWRIWHTMIFDWLDAKADVQFGIRLADGCADRLRQIATSSDKKRNDRLSKLIVELRKQVLVHASQRRLNFYRKARFGNAFRWRLKDEGFDPEIVESLVKELLLTLR